jgi:hypothetical protein
MRIFQIRNLIVILLFFSFLFALLNAVIEVSIIESSYQLICDEDITISINVSGIEPTAAMRAFAIDISYDTNYFQAGQSDFAEGEFLSGSNDETQWLISGVDGNYTATCSILGVTSGSSGSGTLFTLFLTNLNNDVITGTNVTLSNIVLKDLLNNDLIVDVIGNCQISIDASPAFADFTLLLEGPYISASGGVMNHDLTDGGFLPTISPYDSQDIGSIPNVSPNFIVDWINIQLRTSANGATVNSTNAFLLQDGSIVDVDGNSSFPFYYTTNIGYYIVIRHRNHLDIMTATTKIFGENSGEATEIDFTELANVYGTDGVKQMETGIYAMWAGDADGNNRILSSDQVKWNLDFGVVPFGYHYSDTDINGRVLTSDQIMWNSNFGIAPFAQVPAQN